MASGQVKVIVTDCTVVHTWLFHLLTAELIFNNLSIVEKKATLKDTGVN